MRTLVVIYSQFLLRLKVRPLYMQLMVLLLEQNNRHMLNRLYCIHNTLNNGVGEKPRLGKVSANIMF